MNRFLLKETVLSCLLESAMGVFSGFLDKKVAQQYEYGKRMGPNRTMI